MDGENTSKKSVFVFWGFSGTFWKEIFHRGSFIIISIKEEHGSVQYANDVLLVPFTLSFVDIRQMGAHL